VNEVASRSVPHNQYNNINSSESGVTLRVGSYDHEHTEAGCVWLTVRGTSLSKIRI